MPRIAIDVDSLVEDLFADFRFTTRQREWTATLFSTPRVKTESKEPQQVGYCLRFENHGIRARLENFRIASLEGFANCFIGDASSVQLANVMVVAQKVTGARAIDCSCSGRQAHQARLFVDEVAVLCRRSTGFSACLVESGANHFRLFASRNDPVDFFGASRDGNV